MQKFKGFGDREINVSITYFIKKKKNQAKLFAHNHKNHEWKAVWHVAKMLPANGDCTVENEVGEEGGQWGEKLISPPVTKNICPFLQDH